MIVGFTTKNNAKRCWIMIKYRNHLGSLMSQLGFKTAVEVGVQQGLFSEQILSRWRNGHLFLVDAWESFAKETYDDSANVSNEQHLLHMRQTEENLIRFKGMYTLIKGYSNEVYKQFDDHYFDLVYLDANHSYESVYEDISLWINKVKHGGYICGHDYVDGYIQNHGQFGVKSAVKDFFKRDPDFVTLEVWPSWFIKIQ